MVVYISGPITIGDQYANVRNAVDVADRLFVRGHTPVVPHLSFIWHMLHPHSHEQWLRYDLELVSHCDAVLRITGYSPGADLEEEFAVKNKIPVFHGLDEFMNSELWAPVEKPQERK